MIFDLDPSVGLERARQRGQLDRIESQKLEFSTRAKGYQNIASREGDRCLLIDAGQTRETVRQSLRQRWRIECRLFLVSVDHLTGSRFPGRAPTGEGWTGCAINQLAALSDCRFRGAGAAFFAEKFAHLLLCAQPETGRACVNANNAF